MKEKKRSMFIFYKELTLDEGFDILDQPLSRGRFIDGARISAASGAALFKACKNGYMPLQCWECGLKADRWILKHHVNDMQKPPVLELFAHNGKSLVMMTRDHIIPASFGGVNDVENLRPACSPCNNRRKNIMTDEEQNFMNSNPHLVSKGIKNAKISYN